MVETADVAVIGGSGFYSLFDEPAREVVPATPYGAPSDVITLGLVAGRRVAFLPRHGRGHTIPPHRINSRANIWALQSLGVTRVIAPCAVGSLRADRAPGDVVICDQFIDATKGRRDDTFFDGDAVAHLSAADPYCDEVRPLAHAACRAAGLTAHASGTVVVIDGPRFSTRAESRRHAASGADVINMTQYPEVVLAGELGVCYAGIALITDYDAGIEGDPSAPAVTQETAMAVFTANVARLRDAVGGLLATLPAERSCSCAARRPQPLGHV